MEIKKGYSLIVSGTGNNNHCRLNAGEETEFVSRYKIRAFGNLKITLQYFNRIYSTGCGIREKAGDPFTITAAFIGFGSPSSKKPDFEVPVLFGKNKSVFVEEGFLSDETELEIPEGMWLFVRIIAKSEKDALIPSTDESASAGYKNGLRTLNVLRPNLIMCDKNYDKTLVLFGDSITQGTRTNTDKYEAWSHRVALSQPSNISVINAGMGWSRAYDAAADGLFMNIAKLGDAVTICFGVNDLKSGKRTAEELSWDLKQIIFLLKENNPYVQIILFTIPPFNLEPWEESQRQTVNKKILGGEFDAQVFDFGKVLELENGRVRPEYMADANDAHPNGIAGEAAQKEFLSSNLLN